VKAYHVTILVSTLLVFSCALDKDKKATTTPQSQVGKERSVEEWVGENSKDNGFKKDAQGNYIPKSDKRSPYESQGSTYDAKKSFKKTDYKAGDFAKQSWWGNKEYNRQTYTGNTDGSRFQQTSSLQGEKASEAKEKARIAGPYPTENYATNSALEAGNRPITKGTSDAIETRRKAFQQPDIVDWREQRSLSLEQSKGILGR
jgi:hypothetical protein